MLTVHLQPPKRVYNISTKGHSPNEKGEKKMKYYYKDQLVKKSKRMDYKFTLVGVNDDHAFSAHTSYENAVAELKKMARMRASWCNISVQQAFNELCETIEIKEFTRIEA
jgi:hypothetical protein